MSVIFKKPEREEKHHIHLVFIGHLDHGKSSLLGRLFYDTKNIGEKDFKRIKKIAKELEKEGFEFAFVTDQIKEERMRGITIGLAHKKLLTKKTSFTFADAPGHKDFIKNMLTGTSEADAAILVIAADEGIQSQTKEHLFLAKMLGVPQLVVAVNKMDLINFSKKGFEKLKSQVQILLKKAGYKGYKFEGVPILPCSALFGDNVIRKSKKMSWYKSKTLLQTIENLPGRVISYDLPLRLPIQDIYKINGENVIIGRLSSGIIEVGEKIFTLPSKKSWLVKQIFIHDKKIKKAEAGDNIYLYLTPPFSEKEIKRGDIISKVNNPPTITKKFQAQIIINRLGEIKIGFSSIFEMFTESSPCKITKFIKKIDTTSGVTLEKNPRTIKNGESAIVEIKTQNPIYIETQSQNPLANFRLLENGQMIGMGICIKI